MVRRIFSFSLWALGLLLARAECPADLHQVNMGNKTYCLCGKGTICTGELCRAGQVSTSLARIVNTTGTPQRVFAFGDTCKHCSCAVLTAEEGNAQDMHQDA